MMKAGSCKLTDVTKLLQKQRRDSQCNGIGLCRILSTGRLLSICRGTHRVGNSAVSPQKFFSISCVAIAVENLTRRRRRKNCDASNYQSNYFTVSRKRFKPSTPGSICDSKHPFSLHTNTIIFLLLGSHKVERL